MFVFLTVLIEKMILCFLTVLCFYVRYDRMNV